MTRTPRNLFYGQSGGVTAVINASAAGVLAGVRRHPQHFGKVFAGVNGILGALQENLIDVSAETDESLRALMHTPGGAFGSCRYKLQPQDHQRLLEVFAAHDVGYFFYNGGGDSQDTVWQLTKAADEAGYPLTCIGIPKTIDNDLPLTDSSPGFGSAAKYIAVSALEVAFDLASCHTTSTQVFVLEVMGRHTGWLAAASCLAGNDQAAGPDIILLPEVPFDAERVLEKVETKVCEKGFCLVVAAEGVRTRNGEFLSQKTGTDAFGHSQLGGAGAWVAGWVKEQLGYKTRTANCDYLQRCARHLASQTDCDQAYAVGSAAADYAVQGLQAVMPAIVRTGNAPYQWQLHPVPVQDVANREKPLPAEFIAADGFSITAAGRAYFAPLIAGEAYPPYRQGLPDYRRLRRPLVPKKLATSYPPTDSASHSAGK